MNSLASIGKRTRRGFTLVELLVVIAIIGVLVALLLPAIQAARESARRTQCSNQLRQLAIAFQNHHDTMKHLPSGGWGWQWLGYPEEGFGKEQPGGWMYNILPYIEQASLHDLGRGATGAAKNAITRKRVESPFEGLNCPSRRSTNVYAFENNPPKTFVDAEVFEVCSKTDYAACGGDMVLPELFGYPADRSTLNSPGFNWNNYGSNIASVYTIGGVKRVDQYPTGVVFGRSEINFRQVSDGTSNTYMVGEKYMSTDHYLDGLDKGDNEPAFAGNNSDTVRTTSTINRANKPLQLGPDEGGLGPEEGGTTVKNGEEMGEFMFGSAHASGFNMAFCDASVRFVSYDVDPETHRTRGHRDDGVVVNEN